MFLEQFGRLVQRFWRWIIVGALVCGIGGASALAMQPGSFRTSASTSVVTNSRAADPATVQALASTVMMSMPAYVALATSPPVTKAGADASGLSQDQVAAGLSVDRAIDSTVITWTLTAEDGAAAQTALDAAIAAFSREVRQGAALGRDDAPLTVVQVTAPASAASPRGFSPLLGGIGGAAVGALLALLVAALINSVRTPISDWDSVELATDAPVLAELGAGTVRTRQFAYVASYLSQRGSVSRVLALGARTDPSPVDMETLARLLQERAPSTVSAIQTGSLFSQETADRVAEADAVLIFVDRLRDDVREFGPEARTARRLCRGTVAILLDSVKVGKDVSARGNQAS